ncbi:MAG: phospholipid carrier-dependent glycosyltransferase [Candidatus Eisenbacteria bacterium]|uniref:Phospholipid carrier-dependent glycosyltransferase n=1 Tax=Eiseniibacteriota bacterium TaxID=2212470 RepID=A0A538U366_UNCEI|nr:MAG: phospholipid carrier-dependent glycosyltransferase [Candidatus Eisenbacteria bacterium]
MPMRDGVADARAGSRGMESFAAATAALLMLRLALAALIPLGDDEGYYWVWSRHPALGYFDHPPFVAWLAGASVQLLGVSRFAMRLPFVLLGTATALLLRRLVCDVTADRRLADRAALLVQITPIHFGLGLLVAPDGPLLFFWMITALAAWRAWSRMDGARAGPWRAIGTIGIPLGAALTAKYVALLIPFSLGAWLAASRRPRRWPAWIGACALALVLFAPVVWWNAHHDWASFRYQFQSRHSGASFHLDRFGTYVASQLGFLSPIVFALVTAAALRLGSWSGLERASGESFLWWMGAPTLLVFAIAGAVTSFKPNWPAAGYLTMIPLALRGLDRRAPARSRMIERAAIGLALASVLLVAAHAVRPFVPLPGEADPTRDMRGWPAAARAAERAAADLRARAPRGSKPPFFAAGRYPNASRLEFSLPDHPAVICLAPERDAYDDWQDLDSLRGRDCVFVSSSRFPASLEQLARVRGARIFEIVRAPAGPRTVHVITVQEGNGFAPPPAVQRQTRGRSR